MAIEEVLVIDRDQDSLDAVRMAVTARGLDVHTCTSGSAALQMLGTGFERAKAVFINIFIDDMSALDLLRQIKSDARLRHLPVVVLAPQERFAELSELVSKGASSYLVAPYEERMVAAVLQSVIRDRRELDAVQEESRDFSQAIQFVRSVDFEYATTHQARSIASYLAQACPDPNRVLVGLGEIMVNAVEHGNLEIDYEEKSLLIEKGLLDQEMATRLKDPAYGDRRVKVRFMREPGKLLFRVEDEGAGFDWNDYLDIDLARVSHAHGRGIAIARQISFDDLVYEGAGNIVTATVFVSQDR